MIRKLKLRIARLCRKIADKLDPTPHVAFDTIRKDIRRYRYERVIPAEQFQQLDTRLHEYIKRDIAEQLVDQLDDLVIEAEDTPEGKRLSTKINVIL